MNQTVLPVHLILDRPNVELRKRRWDLLEHLMPLYSCQQKFNKSVLPTMRITSEQTRRRGGVLIEPLEPDDSDERCIIPTIHPHYIELPKLCTESISTEP